MRIDKCRNGDVIEILTRSWPLPGNCTTESSLALISFSLIGRTRTTTLILSSKGVELPDDFVPMSVESMLRKTTWKNALWIIEIDLSEKAGDFQGSGVVNLIFLKISANLQQNSEVSFGYNMRKLSKVSKCLFQNHTKNSIKCSASLDSQTQRFIKKSNWFT